MLFSLALIFILGLGLGGLFKRIHLPSLLAFLLIGIGLGPYGFNLIDERILGISSELRQIALIIILTRGALALNLKELKAIGKSAIFMCFLPAVFEIIAVTLLGVLLFKMPVFEATLLGSILGAVSPAVIIPKMLHMMENHHGTQKSIPQLIIAGASADDIFVVLIFTATLGILQTGTVEMASILQVPTGMILGAIVGLILGLSLVAFFKNVHMRDSVKIILLLALSFLLVAVEEGLKGTFGFSGLIGLITMNLTIGQQYAILSTRLSQKYNKLWIVAEMFLFVLVGAIVNFKLFIPHLLKGFLLIIGALVVRFLGVMFSIQSMELNWKERFFCGISYLPKATVQAAIGAIPLTLGLPNGELILAIAVLSILLTAPIGAILMDITAKTLVPFAAITKKKHAPDLAKN